MLLLALFPANVNASLNAINFRGEPPTDIWLRAPLQLVFLVATWWSTIVGRRQSIVPRLQPAA